MNRNTKSKPHLECSIMFDKKRVKMEIKTGKGESPV